MARQLSVHNPPKISGIDRVDHAQPSSTDALAWDNVFRDIRQANVYFYTFPKGAESTDLVTLAEDLLSEVLQFWYTPGKTKPLHFACHSTGGLVVKYALAQAHRAVDDDVSELAAACFSIAFFGVPHLGSNIFSNSAYQESLVDILGLAFPVPMWLRKLMDQPNSLREHNELFAPLASRLRKVWTFVEGKESQLSVVGHHDTSGESKQTVSFNIVDKRSAVLSNESLWIGSEEVVPVESDHASLARFGDDDKCPAFVDYIEVLRSHISGLGPKNPKDLDWVLDELRVNAPLDDLKADVHLFYEANDPTGTSMRLWSVYPSLRKLLRDGPAVCLDRRLHKEMSHTKSSNLAPRRASVGNPAIKISVPDEAPGFIDPFLDSSSHVSTARRASLAVEPNSRALGVHGDGARDTSQHSPGIQPRPASPSRSQSMVDIKMRSREVTGDLRPVPHVRFDPYEDNEYRARASQRTYQLPDPSSQRYRWIHIPYNIGSWVASAFRTLGEESGTPTLARALMDNRIWNARQNKPRHGAPHGRFMNPHAEVFLPKKSDVKEHSLNQLVSPLNCPQLVVYVSLVGYSL